MTQSWLPWKTNLPMHFNHQKVYTTATSESIENSLHQRPLSKPYNIIYHCHREQGPCDIERWIYRRPVENVQGEFILIQWKCLWELHPQNHTSYISLSYLLQALFSPSEWVIFFALSNDNMGKGGTNLPHHHRTHKQTYLSPGRILTWLRLLRTTIGTRTTNPTTFSWPKLHFCIPYLRCASSQAYPHPAGWSYFLPTRL